MSKPSLQNNFLIPPADGEILYLKPNATVKDTINKLHEYSSQFSYQSKGLADFLYDSDVEKFCSNIWHFIKRNFAYREDDNGKEQLCSPSYSWHVRRHSGIDCDCYSLLISTILRNKGIKHDFRLVAWEKKGKWQHIYVIAYDKFGNSYAIDCIPEIPRFNYQLNYVDKMDLEVLNGASSNDEILEQSITVNGVPSGITENSTVDDFSEQELEEDPDDEDYDNPLTLSGFAETTDDDPSAIKFSGNNLVVLNTEDVLDQLETAHTAFAIERSKPGALSGLTDVPKEYIYSGRIIESWSDPKSREEALKFAINNSQFSDFYKGCLCQLRQNEQLKGFTTVMTPVYENQNLMGYEENELFGFDELGKSKRGGGVLKKIGQKVKKASNKVTNTKAGKLLKKVQSKVRKVNPLWVTIRNGLLLAAKQDYMGVSSKLKIGYSTENEALSKGYSREQYNDIKNRLRLFEKRFENYGGKKENLKAAILNSKSKGNLGVAPIAAAAASIIKLIMKGLNKIKEKKSEKGELSILQKSDSEIDPQTETTEDRVQEKIPSEDLINSKNVLQSAADKLITKEEEKMETKTNPEAPVKTTSTENPNNERSFIKRQWEDYKWYWIGGTIGFILLLILVIWMLRRSKKKGGSLNGRRRRKPTYHAPRKRRRNSALNGTTVLAGRKPAKRAYKPARKSSKRKR